MFYRPSQISPEEKNKILNKLALKDPSLWSTDAESRDLIANNLGWLNPLPFMEEAARDAVQFAVLLKGKNIKHCILISGEGMGLCPQALIKIFGSNDRGMRLDVIDSLDIEKIERLTSERPLAETFFIIAGKKETSLEVLAFFHYFWSLCKQEGLNPGDHFAAIADELSPLQEFAKKNNFFKIFINPRETDSFLSSIFYPALFTLTISGNDCGLFIDRLKDIVKKCSLDAPWEKNPACNLAEFLSEYGVQNRDKLAILADEAISPFSRWIEQLIASFTGKETHGIVPVIGETTGIPGFYGGERIFVYLRLQGTPEKDSFDSFVGELRKADFPVYEIVLRDLYDLGGQFFFWSLATLLISHFFGINPFDEKEKGVTFEKAMALIDELRKDGKFPVEFWVDPNSQISFRTSKMLAASMKSLSRTIKDIFAVIPTWGYLGFLSYLPEDNEVMEIIGEMRHMTRQEKGCATTYNHGPGYLYSTGQIHKEGPISSAFIIFTRRQTPGLHEIPETGLTFWQIQFALAGGDFDALADANRRVVHVHLSDNYLEGLKSFSKVFSRAIRI